MRKIALDLGDRRIGIAYTDELGIFPSGGEVYFRKKTSHDDVLFFSHYVKNINADLIVIGLPLNMDGSEGERAELVKKFGDSLSKLTDVSIVYHDERLSTVEAEEILIERGLNREERKKVIDKVAASIILQSYLNK